TLAAAHAQSSPPDSGDAPAVAVALVTVHGVVKNAATGQPLPRVLVSVESQSGKGALTDADGRFEISGVPAGGTVPIDLTKPGFEDTSGSRDRATMWADHRDMPHPVTVAADMPDLEFAMRPLDAIRGQIELSTGEPAEGFRLELLERSVSQGRPQWQVVGATAANADGAFRFGGLADGVYSVATQPSIDGDGGRLIQLGGKSPPLRTGYPRVFYPDARNLSAAALIHVSAGETAQANFALKQEQFHLVQALVSGAGLESVGGGTSFRSGGTSFHIGTISVNGSSVSVGMSGINAELTDTRGHASPYRAEYDARSHIVQALLPDGDYTLRVSAFGPSKPIVNSSGGIVTEVKNFLSGQADVTVDGRAVTNLRIAMGPDSSNDLEVLVNRTSTEPPPQQDNGNRNGIFITASQAGADASDPMSTEFAQGGVPGTLETQPLAPGSYWLQTNAVQGGLCESSFTAGGANLAREPLVVSANGSTAPLTLTLRDDCASLKVILPEQIAPLASGELPMVYVYVVPDFDSTAEVRQNVLQSAYSSSALIEQLTPGAYHVFALTAPRNLPFHDPDAMAALNLQGQAVTLSPGASDSLVLEVPAP
ncbi:MAG: carboxypeptidase regulatory-like domain-containing protein, partial [Terracidiphilus sp.]